MSQTELYLPAARILAVAKEIWCTDLDETLTLKLRKKPTSQETLAYKTQAEKRAAFNALADEAGALPMTTSGRTSSLTMSTDKRRLSREHGLNVTEPFYGTRRDGSRYYVPLEEHIEFRGAIDKPLSFNWGEGVIVLQDWGGYSEDAEYRRMLGDDTLRMRMLRLVEELDWNGRLIKGLALIDQPWTYPRKSDVPGLFARVQFHFKDADKRQVKKEFQRRFAEGQKTDAFSRKLVLIEETDPKGEREILYLMPKMGRKAVAYDYIWGRLSQAANIPLEDIRVTMWGDRKSDFDAAREVTSDVRLTYVDVGDCTGEFLWGLGEIGETLPEETKEWNSRARETEIPGMFTYHPDNRRPFTVVLSNVAFDKSGPTGPDAVLAYLRSPLRLLTDRFDRE